MADEQQRVYDILPGYENVMLVTHRAGGRLDARPMHVARGWTATATCDSCRGSMRRSRRCGARGARQGAGKTIRTRKKVPREARQNSPAVRIRCRGRTPSPSFVRLLP